MQIVHVFFIFPGGGGSHWRALLSITPLSRTFTHPAYVPCALQSQRKKKKEKNLPEAGGEKETAYKAFLVLLNLS